MLTTGLLFLGRTPLLPNSRIDDSLKIYFQPGVNLDLANRADRCRDERDPRI
jgi:hypothetical protein